MLGFLWRRFTRRKRNLFSYWDGSRMRSDDPLAIQMRIETHPTCRWDVHPIAAERGDVEIHCDFCGQRYVFDPVDAAQLFTVPVATGAGEGAQQQH